MTARPEPLLKHPILVDDLELELCHFGPKNGRSSVLLIHGASANRDTFLVPDGGLVRYLGECDYDVRTLDWRGSARVIERLLKRPPAGSRDQEYRRFTLDRVGMTDIPLAVEAIAGLNGGKRVSIVAHCFGAGACAVSIALGKLPNVQHVVLSTLGLFYEAPWDGWLKAEDFILERVLAHAPECRALDSRHPEHWPKDMLRAYDDFPACWLPAGSSPADQLLQRLTFMFGQPYPVDVLAPGIHGPTLSELFGGMHIGLYLHAGQLLRRGYAAPFDQPDVIDRTRLPPCEPVRDESAALWPPRTSYLEPEPFRDMRITLLTGTENRLWHRDSIDLMYEWLRNEATPSAFGGSFAKHVLRGYAHQDLLWGARARRDVYPLIANGLG